MRRVLIPALALLLRGGPALAAELNPAPVAHGERIVLGDLFLDAGPAANLFVGRAYPGQATYLDATKVQLIARSNGVDWGNPGGMRQIAVAPAEFSSAAQAPVKARKAVAVLAYVHNLNAGDIVRADDLTWSKDAVAGSDAPHDPDAIIGMAARRPIREGDAASLRDVSAPQVIHKDDIITVAFNMGGVNLSLQAKANENAIVGQSLTVTNPASKKVILVVASGPGQALVGPEADELKFAARTTPSRLALR
jgi:flagella basal body P-ring formation protein FlgA